MKFRFIGALAIWLIPVIGYTSPTLKGTINELWVADNNHPNTIFIRVGDTFTSPCSTSPSRYLIMDLDEPGMKEAYSMAMAAFFSNMEVSIGGKGNCRGSLEKLQYINVIK
ncbi:hypothetical protein [Teredinibacter sp. KSP-S5-2]|uniref:hypothetical protein n=1 Tax=Teredinibacter sp. KSP-S5-2 TaxID=3034506 RepID=UPI00293496F8|nr:hypothetical protein [Teredinibacter sp. KSP-S5-2]WNO08246.1 hypothetical protein P5V12_14845 [Teredinibacter sp. KSP-S5-2]